MNDVESLKTRIEAILSYRYRPLTSRPEWDGYSFADCATAYVQLFDAHQKLGKFIDKLPPEAHRPASAHLTTTEQVLTELDEFTPKTDNSQERRDEIADRIRSHAGTVKTQVDTWVAFLEHADKARSPFKKVATWANEYKEVMLLVASVLAIWSYFATKSDLQNNVDKLTCLLNTHVVALNTQNEIDRLALRLEQTTRKLERLRNTNAPSHEIDDAKDDLKTTKEEMRVALRRKNEIAQNLALLSGRSEWDSCPL